MWLHSGVCSVQSSLQTTGWYMWWVCIHNTKWSTSHVLSHRLVVVTSVCPLFELAAQLDSERHSNKVQASNPLPFSLSPFHPAALPFLFPPRSPSFTHTPPFPIHTSSPQIFRTAALKYLWENLFSKATIPLCEHVYIYSCVEFVVAGETIAHFFPPRVNTFVRLFWEPSAVFS